MKKFAIPTTQGLLSGHFGHCEQFYIAEVEDNKIINETMVTPPAHEPGLYPKWVKSLGVDTVIGGGMGQKARDLFAQNGVEIFVGAPLEAPRKVLEAFLSSSLSFGNNTCDH